LLMFWSAGREHKRGDGLFETRRKGQNILPEHFLFGSLEKVGSVRKEVVENGETLYLWMRN
jgi:hypothetical protein